MATAEYPVEQFMRDCKIASMYEGTNGIQALDLVGRKLGYKQGASLQERYGNRRPNSRAAKKNFASKIVEL